MVSAVSNTTHRDRTSTETPHRRLFVRDLFRVMTRAFSSIRGTETSATATSTVVGATCSAAFSEDRKTVDSRQQTANGNSLAGGPCQAVCCLLTSGDQGFGAVRPISRILMLMSHRYHRLRTKTRKIHPPPWIKYAESVG